MEPAASTQTGGASSSNPLRINGAQALIKSLECEGVDVMFGYPGGAILPVYDPILDSPIRHVLARHEQGAGHMAEGYAHATGRPGVCIVTSGPAATNVVTPLADAYLDSVPIVCITGQVALPNIGTDAFQEVDTTGITRSITKHNFLVNEAKDIPRVVKEAFHIATTGRPGPVLIDVPKNITAANNPDSYFDWYYPDTIDLPGYEPTVEPDDAAVAVAVDLMFRAERPVLYVGGGVLKARASNQLVQLATEANIPVVTTLMARGALPDSHPLNLGMPGMHGNYTAVTAMQRCDLLIAMGSRFDDRVTGKVSAFAPDAQIIHVDIDPAEHGKIRQPDVPIVGDCGLAMDRMLAIVAEEKQNNGRKFKDHKPWIDRIRGWQEQYPLVYQPSQSDQYVKPQYVIEQLHKLCPDDTVVTAGVGQHQMWASQYWGFEHPYTWINSGGLGTMGFAVPAAVGAKVGLPDRMVWAVDGDGCFQMTSQELITAAIHKIPVKVALINNAYLGMVRQWQEMFYDERYSEVRLGYDLPDYVALAEAMGCVGLRVETADDVAPTIAKANEINDRPVLIEFRCDSEEKVFPMVTAGGSNDDILVDPSQPEPDRSR